MPTKFNINLYTSIFEKIWLEYVMSDVIKDLKKKK